MACIKHGWRGELMVLLCCSLTMICGLSFAAPVVSYMDTNGATSQTQAPVYTATTLDTAYLSAAQNGRLVLRELDVDGDVESIPAQIEAKHGGEGKLWWRMPKGQAGERKFELSITETQTPLVMGLASQEDVRYTFTEQERPVLTYNFGTIPVPDGVSGIYAVARSNYVHPIFGPDGVELTQDYSPDHPHHRGIYWAWPEVTYKGKMHDLHALQGVFARPVKIIRQEQGPVYALLEAENVWMWEDKKPIVREWVVLRVYATSNKFQIIDFEFRFQALEPGVSIARRGQDAYGGLNMRLSARSEQQIVSHIGPKQEGSQQAWAELSGIPKGQNEPIAITLLQSPDNPHYPDDWVQYPEINWLQPTFPSKGIAYQLPTDRPLKLAYRINIHSGRSDATQLAHFYEAYQAMLSHTVKANTSNGGPNEN